MKKQEKCSLFIQIRRHRGRKQYRFWCMTCNSWGRWKASPQEAAGGAWYHDDFLQFVELCDTMGGES